MRVAIGQVAPAFLDLAGSVAKACDMIAEAGRRGVRLLAFPEAWLPCYPLWCDTGTLGKWENKPSKRLHARLLRNSLAIPSRESHELCAAARNAGVAVVVGANERAPAGGSLYNALLFIDERGAIVGIRRKLVPTLGERLVWAYGAAAGLESFALGGARVGGLICWEHWMPLARQVLHAAGEEIHVAAWPHGKEPHQLASRHYAFEGRAFVLASALYLRKADLPDDFELADDFRGAPEELLPGGSAIIAPDGSYVVEPVFGREELLVTDLELGRSSEEKLALDVAGHYARPDLFELRVRRDRLEPLRDAERD